MADVNLTAISNVSEFKINNSLINNSGNFTQQAVQNANDSTGGYFGLIIMVAMFIVFVYTLFDKTGLFREDIVRATVKASGLTVFLGGIMLVSEIITSYQHFMWFVTILVLSSIASYLMKKRGI